MPKVHETVKNVDERTSVTRDLKPFLPGRTLKRITLNFLGRMKVWANQKMSKVAITIYSPKNSRSKDGCEGRLLRGYFRVVFSVSKFGVFGQKKISSTPEWVCQNVHGKLFVGWMIFWPPWMNRRFWRWCLRPKLSALKTSSSALWCLGGKHWRFVKTWVL